MGATILPWRGDVPFWGVVVKVGQGPESPWKAFGALLLSRFDLCPTILYDEVITNHEE